MKPNTKYNISLDLAPLMVSVSGVRGIVGKGMEPSVILGLTLAFSSSLPKGSIVLARDGRPSGDFIEPMVASILQSVGRNVLRLGIVPTPTIKSVVKETKSAGGIMISSSHNPLEWNAFKLIGKDGFFFSSKEMDKLLDCLAQEKFEKAVWKNPSPQKDSTQDPNQRYIASLLKGIDTKPIKTKKFKVLVDAVNSSGSHIIPAILESLGCQVIRLHCVPDGTFPRPPEPTPEALKSTSKIMQSCGADIGFALDPDADRLVVLTPKRGAISEEYTVPLAYLSKVSGKSKTHKVVLNQSTSFILEAIAKRFKGTVVRSKVGEANVVSEMIASKAVFGGEGNGGVIDPSISSFGRDALVGILHILRLMALRDQSIDKIMDEMPSIHMEKTTIPLGSTSKEKAFAKFQKAYSNFPQTDSDGIRVSLPNGWIHLRASNTEPILRLIAEGEDETSLREILSRSKQILRE